jgi:glycosyltransferase involved in cell wall biosynthesis
MRILYLYSEIMGYTLATVRILVESGCEVHIIHWDHKKVSMYKISEIPNVFFYKRSHLTLRSMVDLVLKIKPSITVVSGWMDLGYLIVAVKLIKDRRYVVMGLDSQWRGTLKQKTAVILGRLGIFSIFFSHVWVAGILQFEYARNLGFRKSQIVFDLYSADVSVFDEVFKKKRIRQKAGYPHRFVFLGRLEPVKGLNILLQAWGIMANERSDWELHLIGSGSLKEILTARKDIIVKEFLQPDKLMEEVEGAGCLVLPSLNEPWGVVVHELATAGLPLIVSDVVGAASAFLIPGLNGYFFNVGDSTDLAIRLRRIISMKDLELQTMSFYSNSLAKRITPETSAKNLLSIVR